MSTDSPYDLEALVARTRQALGQEFDEDAAGRPGVDDDDRYLMDTEGFFSGEGEGSPVVPADAPTEVPVTSDGTGSEGEGETAPTAPSPSDTPSLAPASASDLPPVQPGEEIPVTREPAEPEVVFSIPGVTDDEPIPVESAPVSDDQPASTEPAPASTSTPASSGDAFDWNKYWTILYGAPPPVEQVEGIFSFVERVNSLPPEHQSLVASIVEGQFDPVAYAQSVLPRTRRDIDDDDPYLDPSPAPAPAPVQQIDPRVQHQLEQAQQWRQQMVASGVQEALADFRQAHPHVDAPTFRALAAAVNRSSGWVLEVERGVAPREAYLRHLNATALASPQLAPLIQAMPAPTPASTPTPAPTPTVVDQAARQARNAAIAGTSSPSSPSPRRRSALGSGDAAQPIYEKSDTPADAERKLRDAMSRGVAEVLGRS